MASPFAVFRKHQRAMMAVVGILCMIAFAIGGVTLDMLDQRGGGENPVVATSVAGELKESDVQALRENRNLANRFVSEAMAAAYGEQQAKYMAYFSGFDFDFPFGPPTEKAVVQTHIMAERAERLGIVISQSAVNDFLREQTGDKVSREAFRSIVRQVGASTGQVFSALASELAAQRLQAMLLVLSSRRTTPAERWEYYGRMRNRATVEVAPIRVSEFISKIDNPSDAELQEFFDKYKDVEPVPGSPEPGFKVPHQAAFEYLKADQARFFAEASAAVTKKQIKAYYNKNKEKEFLYRDVADLFPEDDAGFGAEKTTPPGAKEPAGNPAKVEDGEQTSEPAKGTEKAADAGTPAAADGEESPPAVTAPDEAPSKTPDQQPPAEDADDAEAPSQDPAVDDGESGDVEEPAEESDDASDSSVPSDEGEPNNEGEPSDEDQSSLNSRVGSEATQLATVVVDGCQPTVTEAADVALPTSSDSEAESDTVPGPRSPDPDSASTSGAAKSKSKRSDLKSTAKKKKPAKAKKPAPAIGDNLVLPRDIRQGVKPKFDPLWKVDASIRRALANERATKKMTDALQSVQDDLVAFRTAWDTWTIDPQYGKPKRPNFKALAAAHGLTAHKTTLVAQFELEPLHPDLGGAAIRGPSGAISVPELAFSPNMPLFQSQTAEDTAGNRYLFWKVREREAYVPKFNKVRHDALRSWKMIRARRLALKKADQMVAQAKKKKAPLSKVFDDESSVFTTPPFTWMTAGSAGGMDSQVAPTLSQIEGVEDAGQDFMAQVFSMKPGQVGRVMNEPQSVVYVVRLVSLLPDRQLLRDTFMAEPYRSYEAAASDDIRRRTQQWLDGLLSDAQLVWRRPPDESDSTSGG